MYYNARELGKEIDKCGDEAARLGLSGARRGEDGLTGFARVSMKIRLLMQERRKALGISLSSCENRGNGRVW